jgi:hypothetical protein
MRSFSIIYFILSMIILFAFTGGNLYATPLVIDGEYNVDLLSNQQSSASAIILRSLPTKLYRINENIEIIWEASNAVDARLYVSRVPRGASGPFESPRWIEPSNQNITAGPVIGGSPTRRLNRSATALNLDAGVWYAVIHNPAQSPFPTSIEFKIIVQSPNAVNPTSPRDNIPLSESTPLFTWPSLQNVPYYHITLSDTRFTISEVDDKTVIENLSAIWMAITPNLEIRYGDIDPSGHFLNQSPPPLIPGNEYNWVVMANYGNDPLYSSALGGRVIPFIYGAANLPRPVLTYPPSQTPIYTTNANTINFAWERVPSAIRYQVFLYEERDDDGSIVLYPVWNQTTTNNSVQMNARSILINSNYSWRVIAVDALGNMSMSDPNTQGKFHYNIDVGTLNLTIRDEDGNPVSFASVSANPLDASMDDVPFTVDGQGTTKKKLPVGTYEVYISKPGYEPTTRTVFVKNNPFHDNEDNLTDQTMLNVVLEYSRIHFVGEVRHQANNSLITHLSVRGVRSSDGLIREVYSSSGHYSLSILPGLWTISAIKDGLVMVATQTVNVPIGSLGSIPVQALFMNQRNVNISGKVSSDGIGLPLATVTLTQGSTVIATRTTNSAGNYTFSGVPAGELTVSFARVGYSPPASTTLTIAETNRTVDAIMIANANIVTGSVTNGTTGIGGVRVTATPIVGTPRTATTDHYGGYTLNLPAGDYTIRASHNMFTAQNFHRLNLSVGETLNAVNIVMSLNQSSISGVVTTDGIVRSGVRISSGDATTTTNASGVYTLSVGVGTHTIMAEMTGFITESIQNISVGSQPVQNMNFSLIGNPAIITGQVLLAGQPVPNATIVGYRTEGVNQIPITSVSAGGDGRYTLSLNSGSYTIAAVQTGIIFNPVANLTLSAGSSLSNINILGVLNQGTITGNVVNDQGVAVQFADIIIENYHDASIAFPTVTNIHGQYNITVPAGVRYRITATKEGFNRVSASPNAILAVSGTINQPFTLIGQSSAITGNVKDQNGLNIPDATIIATRLDAVDEPYTTRTNPLGNYELSMPYGNWRINVSKLGYLPAERNIVLAAGQTLAVEGHIIQTNFANLSGTIRNATNNNPMAGVTVAAHGTLGIGGTVSTNLSGIYSFTGLIPGTYTLTFQMSGFVEHEIENVVLIGNQANPAQNVNLSPLNGRANITITNTTDVNMRVVNTQTGLATTHRITNPDGTSTIFSNLTPYVPLRFEFTRAGFVAQEATRTLSSTGTETFSITMPEATGRIGGTVVNANETGIVVAGTVIQITNDMGFSRSFTTTSSGSFEFSQLPYGTYKMTATHSGFYWDTEEWERILTDGNDSFIQEIRMTPNNFQISGEVRNQLGEAIAGMSIPIRAVSAINTITATSQTNGTFVLPGLSPREVYTVSTNSNQLGHINSSMTVTTQIQSTPNQNLTLTLNTASISGSITSSGAPISGATIVITHLTNETSFTTASTAGGTYTFNNIPNGSYKMDVTATNHIPVTISSITVGIGSQITQNVPLVSTAPVTITGTVRDKNTTNPVSGRAIPVRLTFGSTTIDTATNLMGVFSIPNVPSHTSNINIRTLLPTTDFDNSTIIVSTMPSDPLDNRDILVGVKTASVSGRVRNAISTSENIANATVTLSQGTEIIGMITTGSSGEYSFSNLYAGQYELRTSARGYVGASVNFSLVNDQSDSSRNIDMTPIQNAIAGYVTNAAHQPLDNVRIEIHNGSSISPKFTDAAGFFIFDDISTGTYTLTATKAGYDEFIRNNVTLTDTDMSIIMTVIPNSIVGTVRNASGAGVADAIVRAMDSQNFIITTYANDKGDYYIPSVTGFMIVQADNTAMTSFWNEVIVPAGGSVSMDLLLEPTRSISGTVSIASTSYNIPAAMILATHTETNRSYPAFTNKDGVYTITGLRPATYSIAGSKTGYNFPAATVRSTFAGSVTGVDKHVTLRPNNVSGAVINDITGYGFSDAEIELHPRTITSRNRSIPRVMTTPAGAFNFQNIQDGDYTLKANHGAFATVSDVNISVVSGMMIPPTVKFEMSPFAKSISVIVTDKWGNRVSGASVLINGLKGFTFNAETINGNVATPVTDDDTYTIVISKDKHKTIPPIIRDITPQNPNIQIRQIIELLPAVVEGRIVIIDDTVENPPDSYEITLIITDGETLTSSGTNTQAFTISEIELPNAISVARLTVEATYRGTTFRESLEITLTAGETTTIPRFEFDAEAKTLSGNVRMLVNSIPTMPQSAIISLYDYATETLVASVEAVNGTYQFNKVYPGEYILKAEINYDFEVFDYESEKIVILEESREYNIEKPYILATIQITLLDDIGEPVPNHQIIIPATPRTSQITLLTDNVGRAETEPILYRGEYPIRVQNLQRDGFSWIVPININVEVSKLESHPITIELPLKYEFPENNTVSCSEPVNIYITTADGYAADVFLNFTNLIGETFSLRMRDGFATIAAQNQAGTIQFFFTSTSGGITYSNVNYPYELRITTAGVLSPEFSRFNSGNNPIFRFGQVFHFEIDVLDELENSFNSEVDALELTESPWRLDTLIEHGTLLWNPTYNRRVTFTAPPALAEEIISNGLTFNIRLNNSHLVKKANIQIMNIRPENVVIEGSPTLNNRTPHDSNLLDYSITIRSERHTMAMDFIVLPIESYKGTIEPIWGGIRYRPNPLFVGDLDINILVDDDMYNAQGNRTIRVFRRISPIDTQISITNDQICSIILPDGMATVGTGEIDLFIRQVAVSPVQQVDIKTDVHGKVYRVSIRGNDPAIMPDIMFDVDDFDEDMNVAWWNDNRLQWQTITASPTRTITPLRVQMPGWYHYSVLSSSLPLGLYDLRLFPNPFTPHDIIRERSGLQISFRISTDESRYPLLTAKVYNLQGTLVRTLANKEPTLKGDYRNVDDITLYWNGYTDDGRMARNGRYIIHLVVEDALDRKEYLKSVVLIK